MFHAGRGVVVALTLVVTACAPGQSDALQSGLPEPATPTTVVTTAPAATVAPTSESAASLPTAVVVPSPPPTALPVPDPTATSTPTPTATSTLAPTPEAAAEPVAPAPPEPTSVPSGSQAVLVANGAEVYTLNCARCHAETGTGSARYSGLIGVGGQYSTAGMIAELTNGHPVTFGFADKLSDDEIASVVAYVKATFP